MWNRLDQNVEHHLHLSAEQIGKRRSPAAIRHMDQINAGHHLEQFAGNMLRASYPARPHVELAGICLGIGDELWKRLDRNRWVHIDYLGRARDACDGRDVAVKGEIKFVKSRVNPTCAKWPPVGESFCRSGRVKSRSWVYSKAGFEGV